MKVVHAIRPAKICTLIAVSCTLIAAQDDAHGVNGVNGEIAREASLFVPVTEGGGGRPPRSSSGVNPTFLDCNQNQQSDSIDISTGASEDVNGNFIPDECPSECDLQISGEFFFSAVENTINTLVDVNQDGIHWLCFANGTIVLEPLNFNNQRIEITRNDVYLYARPGSSVLMKNQGNSVSPSELANSVLYVNGVQNFRISNLDLTAEGASGSGLVIDGSTNVRVTNLLASTMESAALYIKNSIVDEVNGMQHLDNIFSNYRTQIYVSGSTVKAIKNAVLKSGLGVETSTIDLISGVDTSYVDYLGHVPYGTSFAIYSASEIETLENSIIGRGMTLDGSSRIERISNVNISQKYVHGIEMRPGAEIGIIENTFIQAYWGAIGMRTNFPSGSCVPGPSVIDVISDSEFRSALDIHIEDGCGQVNQILNVACYSYGGGTVHSCI